MKKSNLNNVRRKASRHFGNKKMGYLRDRINELELSCNSKNIRNLYKGVTKFKEGYQPRTNLVKDDKGDLIKDPHKITSVSY
jgi:hypothetical protein